MQIIYTKRFSKDLDGIGHDKILKRRLLEILEDMKQASSIFDLKDAKKIKGYDSYYSIRLGDYRLGVKHTEQGLEMLRFLHRKDIYRGFP